MSAGPILVLNAGSSSIKFAVFAQDLTEVLAGMVTEIGPNAQLKIGDHRSEHALPDHSSALTAVLTALDAQGYGPDQLSAVAHRVVHGGTELTRPTIITADVQQEIAACAALAPLHNPHSLAAIETLSAQAPHLLQTASFDTAFHATNPTVATRYAVPDAIDQAGIRRYGFHGTSYASLVRLWPEITGEALPKRVLAFHLGNGASICAIRDGQSVATTMGYSPLEGLTMGTRAGGIDANAVLRLVDDHGMAATRRLLNTESGLLGLSGGAEGGTSDMRHLLAGDSAAYRLAVEHFCYWALRHAGSLIAAMEGCDAIVFTGGIGENAAEIRARILAGLKWIGATLDPTRNAAHGPALHAPTAEVSAWVIPAEEERMIARDAIALMTAA